MGNRGVKILCNFLFQQTYPNDPETAVLSLPPGLVVKESGIPGVGLGVWSIEEFK